MSTQQTPFPLARPEVLDRSGSVHTHHIPLPPALQRDSINNAAAAAAALLYRYTAEHSIRLRLTTDHGTPTDLTVRVTGQAPLIDLPQEVNIAGESTPQQAPHAQIHASPAAPTRRDAPLRLIVEDHQVHLEMSAVEFTAEAADQYAAHLETLLKLLAIDDPSLLDDIGLLTRREQQRAVEDWNQTETPIPPAFFHQRMQQVAETAGEKVALTDGTRDVTFTQLEQDSTRLARRLHSLGVGVGDRVGVCFMRSIESIVAQLACFKVGASAILLDPDFPEERIRFMTVDAQAKAVLTVTAHAAKVAAAEHLLCLDTIDWAEESAAPIPLITRPEDLIHICYTSGSTGLPKAVKVRHGAARNLIWSMQQVCGVDSDSHGAWLAAPGYGMVEVEVFPILAAGATVHIPPATIVASPERLQEWMLQQRITHALLMKPMAERLWALPWPADTPLRNVRVCGERILTWPRAGLPFHLVNLYGSAEATVVASCDLTVLGADLGADGRARRLPPIGRPTANVKTYVLDQHLRPTPPGVIGELCIAGDSLSAGYLNQPEATAAKWVPNPLDPQRHPVLYRTGDLARYWSDGNIEIVGRTDSQVKVRGNRVHLGEIEAVLSALPGVQLAAVLPKTDSHGDTWLAAYIEPDPSCPPKGYELRNALLERLPTFMVPGAFVIGHLPTSTNGKIDRAALPEPTRTRAEVSSTFAPAEDELEAAFVALWEELLELPSIGVCDNFFELGGDSLRAARLAELLQDRLGILVDVDELFTGEATIRAMATAIRTPALTAGQSL